MTEDAFDIPDDAVGTAEDFDSIVQELLRVAHRNGVDVEGSWEVRNGDEGPHWELLVHELAAD